MKSSKSKRSPQKDNFAICTVSASCSTRGAHPHLGARTAAIGCDVARTEAELEPAAARHVNCRLVFLTTGLCRLFVNM